MPKQNIEIEIPDGCEIESIKEVQYIGASMLNVQFRDKEPEFIEVREYLSHSKITGYYTQSLIKDHEGYSPPEEVETAAGFKRWLDRDWRKVYIEEDIEKVSDGKEKEKVSVLDT